MFDVRQSAKGRAITRLIIAPLMALGFIWLGWSFLPDNLSWNFAPSDIAGWGFGAVVGFFLVGTGAFALVKEAVFALRSTRPEGEWHFRLTKDELLWQVPDHAHGKEEGFSAKLSEISSVEFRTVEGHEQMDVREYWIHFHDRASVQLRDFCGVSLSWLVEEIAAAGVHYTKTVA